MVAKEPFYIKIKKKKNRISCQNNPSDLFQGNYAKRKKIHACVLCMSCSFLRRRSPSDVLKILC